MPTGLGCLIQDINGTVPRVPEQSNGHPVIPEIIQQPLVLSDVVTIRESSGSPEVVDEYLTGGEIQPTTKLEELGSCLLVAETYQGVDSTIAWKDHDAPGSQLVGGCVDQINRWDLRVCEDEAPGMPVIPSWRTGIPAVGFRIPGRAGWDGR
jgi:hypothetical protein